MAVSAFSFSHRSRPDLKLDAQLPPRSARACAARARDSRHGYRWPRGRAAVLAPSRHRSRRSRRRQRAPGSGWMQCPSCESSACATRPLVIDRAGRKTDWTVPEISVDLDASQASQRDLWLRHHRLAQGAVEHYVRDGRQSRAQRAGHSPSSRRCVAWYRRSTRRASAGIDEPLQRRIPVGWGRDAGSLERRRHPARRGSHSTWAAVRSVCRASTTRQPLSMAASSPSITTARRVTSPSRPRRSSRANLVSRWSAR